MSLVSYFHSKTYGIQISKTQLSRKVHFDINQRDRTYDSNYIEYLVTRRIFLSSFQVGGGAQTNVENVEIGFRVRPYMLDKLD
jgi:hypothetical protein